ncbi:MAG: guanylate kinase [Deltaproteobacteria bacterium]|jgi:guanylate kinase
MPGGIYVISGPSGVGKSALIRRLREMLPDLGYSVSHTTRKPRGEEADGVHYHFVDKETFKRMIDEAAFVEWAEVYKDLYGTSFSSLRSQAAQEVDVVLDVDVQGARNLREHFEESVLIYVLPPSIGVLERRLRERGTDDEEAIRKRIEKATEEIRNCVWYDYLIFNADLEKAVEEAKSVVVSQRCRRSRQLPKAQGLFDITGP